MPGKRDKIVDEKIPQKHNKKERAFLKQGLKNNKKPFAGFYLTLKAHKLKPGQNVRHLKSRPIVCMSWKPTTPSGHLDG